MARYQPEKFNTIWGRQIPSSPCCGWRAPRTPAGKAFVDDDAKRWFGPVYWYAGS